MTKNNKLITLLKADMNVINLMVTISDLKKISPEYFTISEIDLLGSRGFKVFFSYLKDFSETIREKIKIEKTAHGRKHAR